jgi:E3 ubiquitin-protein ligase NEDD4
MKAVLSLSPADFRKIWRFEFIGEDGIDAGGLAREWFHLVTMAIFDADRGLWLTSLGANQTQMHINASSALSCPEDHLIYFRFLGRVCGKALFDEQLISSHLVDYLYKHLLGWPVTFEDLQSADENVYANLKKLCEMSSEDIANMCLDFTLQEETLLGVKNEVELIKDGKNIEVTTDNLAVYLEANLKYRLMDKILPQLTELLLGFFDVIPEALITIFDFRELELALCGVPEINVKDWMENTCYSGTFSLRKERHPTCVWFWDIVLNDFDQEMRARLLQFANAMKSSLLLVPARRHKRLHLDRPPNGHKPVAILWPANALAWLARVRCFCRDETEMHSSPRAFARQPRGHPMRVARTTRLRISTSRSSRH